MSSPDQLVKDQRSQYLTELRLWTDAVCAEHDVIVALRTAMHQPVPGPYLRGVSSSHSNDAKPRQRIIDHNLFERLKQVSCPTEQAKCAALASRLTWAPESMKWAAQVQKRLARSRGL